MVCAFAERLELSYGRTYGSERSLNRPSAAAFVRKPLRDLDAALRPGTSNVNFVKAQPIDTVE